MKNSTNHPALVKLIEDVVARIPETKSFVANRQDPTQVSICTLELNGDLQARVVTSFGHELEIYQGREKIVDLYLDNDGVYFREELTMEGIGAMRFIRKVAEVVEEEESYDEFDHNMSMYI